VFVFFINLFSTLNIPVSVGLASLQKTKWGGSFFWRVTQLPLEHLFVYCCLSGSLNPWCYYCPI